MSHWRCLSCHQVDTLTQSCYVHHHDLHQIDTIELHWPDVRHYTGYKCRFTHHHQRGHLLHTSKQAVKWLDASQPNTFDLTSQRDLTLQATFSWPFVSPLTFFKLHCAPPTFFFRPKILPIFNQIPMKIFYSSWSSIILALQCPNFLARTKCKVNWTSLIVAKSKINIDLFFENWILNIHKSALKCLFLFFPHS